MSQEIEKKYNTTINRFDYREYPFIIKTVHLIIDLDENCTVVTNEMCIERKVGIQSSDLYLNADFKENILIEIKLNGRRIYQDKYIVGHDYLLVKNIPDISILNITTKCFPSKNLSMMGIYLSNSNFFTQCEPEGFRKITCFPDRPDVLSKYTVVLKADQKYSTLLSNGNLVSSRILDNGRQEVIWEDPFLKPSYLFALVVGNFLCREKEIKTITGRNIKLQIYSDMEFQSQTEWAMHSLVKAIKWDEKKYNLEIDLDQYMVVAAKDFNMGAMENKGLNIFNAAYVISNKETSTDNDYENILSVIGHEYFHNWTGNRVTCRDWFQLSLKEGLTVFREQEFYSDVVSDLVTEHETKLSIKAVKRIDDVINLRSNQFSEDNGCMAHPIRPNSYQEISNFYTSTIYEKGAEIIRMQYILLGNNSFFHGISKYFSIYDGKAVTCDDFLNIMESIYKELNKSKKINNFSIFRNWYKLAGTPTVKVLLDYDDSNNTCTITLNQNCDPVGIEKNSNFTLDKKIFHIPFAIGLLDSKGNPINLIIDEENNNYINNTRNTVILELYKETQSWKFRYIKEKPIPSLLRNFSAPVKVDYDYSDFELNVLSNYDTDYFVRWESLQELFIRQIKSNMSLILNGKTSEINNIVIETFKKNLLSKNLDAGYISKMITIPDENILFNISEVIDPILIIKARNILIYEVGKKLSESLLLKLYEIEKNILINSGEIYNPTSANNRLLKNIIIKYLASYNDDIIEDLVEKSFYKSNNMTDSISLLKILLDYGSSDKYNKALENFYYKWKDNKLVIDKWFAVQASSYKTDITKIKKMMTHPDFIISNPNRARSLIFQFCFNNYINLHKDDGSGYDYWAEQVIKLDSMNPEVAARLARALENWRNFIPNLRIKMHNAIRNVYEYKGLSKNTSEIISKTLEIS